VEAAGAALLAALLFALGSALQHRSTEAARLTGAGWGQVVGFFRSVAHHPAWVLAMAVEGVGVSLHAVALHIGTLVLVQPVLVTTIVFALALRRRMDRGRVAGPELGWAAVLTAGLVVFLVMATPAHSSTSKADLWPAVVVSVLSGVVVLVTAVVSRFTNGAARAMLLGTGAGVTFADAAALIKTTGNVLVAHGFAGMFTSWAFWAMLVVGGVGMVLNQLAFQAGPLSASLPAIQTVDPIMSVVLGVAVYDEQLRRGALPLSVEVLGLAATLLATAVLARVSGAQAGVPGDASLPDPSARLLGTAPSSEKASSMAEMRWSSVSSETPPP
jgi:hypothetical protein